MLSWLSVGDWWGVARYVQVLYDFYFIAMEKEYLSKCDFGTMGSEGFLGYF